LANLDQIASYCSKLYAAHPIVLSIITRPRGDCQRHTRFALQFL